MSLRGWMSHSHCTQSLKPLGILKRHGHGRGREIETVTGLFLGMDRESRILLPDLNVPPHLTHAQTLASDWKGQRPQAARDQPCCMYRSVPETAIQIPDKPHLVSPSVGLQDNQSELLRGLNERQLEKKRHFITSTELPFLEPICCQAAQQQDLLG